MTALSKVRVQPGRFFWVGKAKASPENLHGVPRVAAQQALQLEGDEVVVYERQLFEGWANGSRTKSGKWHVARGGWKRIEAIPHRHLTTLAAQGGNWGKLDCANLLVQLDAFLEKHPPRGPSAFERDGVGSLL